MRGHASADSQDALGSLHAFDVLGRGLETDQNDLFLSGSPLFGVFGSEDYLSAGCSRRSSEASADWSCRLEGLLVKLRVEERVEVSRIYHQDCLLRSDHAFVNEIAGNLQSCLGSALAVAALEHIELAVFDGELHVLHVMVMVFKSSADSGEVLICPWEFLGHLGYRHRSTDTGDDILALCIVQELAHELLLACCRVSREGNAGSGVVVEVAEYHRHNSDRGAPGIRDIVVAAVDIRSGVIPGSEDRLNGFLELNYRIGGEIGSKLLFVLCLELFRQLLKISRVELDIQLDALFFLHVVYKLREVTLADFHNDIREHLDKTAV